MGNIANNILNTFMDGEVVSANGTAPAPFENALNPKMEIIRAAVNDNDSRIAILEGQVTGLGGLVYNVKSAPFNAVGNGIADDTAAIQAAITAAVANQGIVVIPNGTYKLTDALTVSGTCYITSDGAGQASILAPSVANKAVFIINSSNVRITDLKLLINVNNSTSAAIYSTTATAASKYVGIVIQRCTLYTTNGSYFHGIRLDHCAYSAITDCIINNPYSGAINAEGIALYSVFYSIIARNVVASYRYCILLTRTNGSLTTYPQCTSVTVEQNTLENTILTGMRIESAIYCTIDSNYFYTFTSVLIQFISIGNVGTAYVDNLTITSNVFDSSYSTAIGNSIAILDSYSSYTRIFQNTFIECGSVSSGYGTIEVNFSQNLTIQENSFRQCQFAGIQFVVDLTVVTARTSIIGNTFVDMYSNSGALPVGCAVYHASQQLLTMAGNTMIRGTKTATYVNTAGLITGLSTNGAYIMYNSNNFTVATNAVFQANPSTICVYYEEPTGDRVFKGVSSAPTTGTWRRGDKVLVDDPSAGGYIGYVCTTAGTPGTWKGYGAIQA